MGLECAKPSESCLGRPHVQRERGFQAEMRKIREVTAFQIKINNLRLLSPCPSFLSVTIELAGAFVLRAPFRDFHLKDHFLTSSSNYSAEVQSSLHSLSDRQVLVSLQMQNGSSSEVLRIGVNQLFKGPVRHDHLVRQFNSRLLFDFHIDQLLRTRISLLNCEAEWAEPQSADFTYSLSLILSNCRSPVEASKVFEKHEKIKEVALREVSVRSSQLKDAVIRVKVLEDTTQENVFQLLLPYSQLQLQNGFKSVSIEGVAFEERTCRIEKKICLRDTTGTIRLQLKFLQSRLYAEQMECVILSEEGIVLHTPSETKSKAATASSGKELSVHLLCDYIRDLQEIRGKGMSEYDLYLFLEKMFINFQDKHFPITVQLFTAQGCLLDLLLLLADCLSSEQQMLNQYLWNIINSLTREPILKLKYFCSIKNQQHKLTFAKKFYQLILVVLRKIIELTAQGINFKELVSIHKFIAYAYFRFPWCQDQLIASLKRATDQAISQEKLAEIGASHALKSPSKSYFYDWETSVLSLVKKQAEYVAALTELSEARRKNANWAMLLFDRDYEQLFYSIYSELWDEAEHFLSNNGRTLWEYFPRYGELLSVFMGEMTSSKMVELSAQMRKCNMKLMRNEKLLTTFMMLIFPKTHLFQTYCVIKCLNLVQCYFSALSHAHKQLPHNFNYNYFLAAVKSILNSQHSYLLQKMLAILYRFYNLFSLEFRDALNHYILTRVVYKLFLHWSQDVRSTFHFLIIFKICQAEHLQNPEISVKRQKNTCDAIETKLKYEHIIDELWSRCRFDNPKESKAQGAVSSEFFERMKLKLGKRDKEKTKERDSVLFNQSQEISENYVRKGSHYEQSATACKRKWSVVEWEPEEVGPSQEELKYLRASLAEFQRARKEARPDEKVQARSRMFQAQDDE